MKAKACKIAKNSHNYCTTCIYNTLKKNYIVNDMGLAR